MKLAGELSREKLRGGFYTPSNLVSICLNRVVSLLETETPVRVLEPSCGDGAFIRGIAENRLFGQVREFIGIEIDDREAELSQESLIGSGLPGAIINDDAISVLNTLETPFDIAVGNPPFLRYQYISDRNDGRLKALATSIGVQHMGVSNLWIPIFLASVFRLRERGVFSFVVPSEILTGISAGVVRKWLISNVADLTIDQFPPKSFPNVLQEIVVVSGRKQTTSCPELTFVQHTAGSEAREWVHSLDPEEPNWTRYLLGPDANSAIDYLKTRDIFSPLSHFVRMEVSIVTGANNFFTVTPAEIDRYGLHDFVVPLVPRTRHIAGIEFTQNDFESIQNENIKSWLLTVPEKNFQRLPSEIRDYLEMGQRTGIDLRYKTSIRDPWYTVPSVWSGDLLLSKRSHLFPKLVLNSAKVMTTDTIYRGRMLPLFQSLAKGLVAGFHNSFTLLSAELEGRSFGGGVLELVPSEISRVLVPHPELFTDGFEQLDRTVRRWGDSSLIEQTDFLLLSKLGDDVDLAWGKVQEARNELLQRRTSRN